MRVERVEISVIGPAVERQSWSHDLPGQYQTQTLLRIVTDTGIEGVAGVWNATSFDYERYTAEALRHIVPLLIGRDPLDREAIRHAIRPRVFPQPPGVLSAIDVAMWDIAGKAAGQPVWKLLGGAMEAIPAYASTPMLDDVGAYLAWVEALAGQGFGAVKFHTWCIPDDDLALARAARQHFPDLTFMLDAENNYQPAEALRVGRELQDLGFAWFEAPLPDADTPGYRELTRQLSIPVLPSGNWIQDLTTFQEVMASGAWGAARSDVTMIGGLTAGAQAMDLARAAGLACEVMSWGHTLAAAANLHLMLGRGNCSYFEQSLPYDFFEFGMAATIRPDREGLVRAPRDPGLGFAIDWPAMESATIHKIVVGPDAN